MKMFTLKSFVIGLLMLPALAFSLEDDQIRGAVVDVNDDARTLTLRILEVGDGLDFEKDAVKTFAVPEEARVEGYLSTNIMASLRDIDKNDTVRVEFDPAAPNVFIQIWTETR